QDNRGPAHARNTGIAAASGEYVAFIDHDDYWFSRKIERQLEYIRMNPAVSVLYCMHNLVFERPEEECSWVPKIDNTYRYNWEIPSSMLLKKTIFDRIGMFNPFYRTAEDSDFFLRLKDAGIIQHVMPEVLFDKNIHGGNISSDIASNRKFLPLLLSESVKRKRLFKNMRISVVIPVYNPGEHLIACIDSVLAQTFAPYEIIIADDGSANDVRALLSEYNDGRIKYFQQDNKGIAGGRNLGLANATGSHVALLDSDDLWTEDKLMMQAVRLVSDSSVKAVFGYVRQFYSREVDEEYRARYAFDHGVSKGIHAGTILISLDDFMRVGLFNEELRLGELFEWFHRFRELGFAYAVIPEVVMYRRLHYNNNGIINKNDQGDFAGIFARIIKDRKKNEKT
ncbi:MAG: glycosyltransferase, partial [Clostridia bacterium]|nr:glycosyltransferase [Clostridia bacterium]